MKKSKKIILIIAIVILIIIIAIAGCCYYLTTPVSNDSESVVLTVEEGSTFSDVAKLLKENELIHSEAFFMLYAKLKNVDELYAADYTFRPNMNLDLILETLKAGGNSNNEEITITFQEGINMRRIATIISENTTNAYEDVFEVLEDEEYLDTLIANYWFLTDEIKNKDIYYPLEGYLFPDTYNFSSKNAGVKEIFEVMLDQMDVVLTPYKEAITNSSYSVHELLTLASLVELEGVYEEDRKNIASVFYNRLSSGMSLGSDVTTYYAIKVDLHERDLYQSELDAYNPYNTRGPQMEGKLPVGPVASPSKMSIEAAIYPNSTDYLYFVADKNRQVYFTKTDLEHQQMIDDLIDRGLWYEW